MPICATCSAGPVHRASAHSRSRNRPWPTLEAASRRHLPLQSDKKSLFSGQSNRNDGRCKLMRLVIMRTAGGQFGVIASAGCAVSTQSHMTEKSWQRSAGHQADDQSVFAGRERTCRSSAWRTASITGGHSPKRSWRNSRIIGYQRVLAPSTPQRQHES